MDPIKEALTFDDVTLVPKYSEILPAEVDTSIKLTPNLKLKIPLLSSAMDTVTESKMAIAMAKAGGIGIIHRNLDIKNQIKEIKKVKKHNLLVGAAVGAGPDEFKRAKAILKENLDMVVVDTAHGHTKKVSEIIKLIKKIKNKKIGLMFGPEASGLSNYDLSFSNYLVQIPSSSKFKSLNLSHSVSIVCYEIFKLKKLKPLNQPSFTKKIGKKGKLTSVLKLLHFYLEKKNFFKPPEKKNSMITNINNLFYRMEANDKELRILASLIGSLAKNKKKHNWHSPPKPSKPLSNNDKKN